MENLINLSQNYRYGDVHGVLLLDKPKGVSSSYVLKEVQSIYKANRAGHTGTLDPLATGMLPICFGEATKFSQYLLNSDKRYRVIAKFGQKTNTSDAYGEIIQECPISFNTEQLSVALNSFRGKILQVPSMYSAIKYQGKKLYEYARQKIEVPRKPRQVTIYELLFIRYEGIELELEIHCSKGTYIRTIIDDLGEKLGCSAHVIYLRRIAINGYSTERMVTLEQLNLLTEQAQKQDIPKSKLIHPLLMPIDILVSKYPKVNLLSKLSFYFKNGNPVYAGRISLKKKSLVCVTEGKEGKFIGIGEIDNYGRIAPRRIANF